MPSECVQATTGCSAGCSSTGNSPLVGTAAACEASRRGTAKTPSRSQRMRPQFSLQAMSQVASRSPRAIRTPTDNIAINGRNAIYDLIPGTLMRSWHRRAGEHVFKSSERANSQILSTSSTEEARQMRLRASTGRIILQASSFSISTTHTAYLVSCM